MRKNKLDNYKIRERVMEIGLRTKCGHIASALSCVDVLCDIYNSHPNSIIILSKGHGCLSQYVILNELGKMPDEVLDTFHEDGGLSGHSTLMPEYGVYASTGSLGHGLGIGIGYAIANPKKAVYVIMGDGECDEGSTLEALKIIQKLELKNILPIIDVNDLQGFSRSDSDLLPSNTFRYFSVKGKDLGECEDKLVSHYISLDEAMMETWKSNSPITEKRRLDNLNKIKQQKHDKGKGSK